jgi:hypothetical protein
MVILVKLLAWILGAMVGVVQPVPVDQPIAEPEAAEVQTFETAGDLLDALEQADRDIRTFSAQIRYVRIFEIQGDVQTRLGWLWYKIDPQTEPVPAHLASKAAIRRRSVAVRFDTLIAGGRQDKTDRVWIFDGEWLVEKNPSERQFIKRRMVKPGQVYDPLRVGEGPFFVPVGQRREDMETFFHAVLRDSSEGLSDEYDPERDAMFKGLAKKLDGLIQLELTPRGGFPEVEDFALIRVWYDPQTLLPRASMTVDPLGDIDVFELFDIDINEQRRTIPADAFSVETPGPGEGYHIEVSDGTVP